MYTAPNNLDQIHILKFFSTIKPVAGIARRQRGNDTFMF